MEEELNYLSEKIEYLDGQLNTAYDNKKNYTTDIEIVFYESTVIELTTEKELLENILNALTINELTPTK